MRRPWEFLRTARSWFVLFGLVVLLPSLCLGWFSLRALRGEQLRQRYAEGERRQQLVRFLDSDLNHWLFALQGAAQIPGGFRFQIDRAELVAPALNIFVGDSPLRSADSRWEQLRQTEGSAPGARSTYRQLVETRSPSAPLARLALFRLASEGGDSKAAQKWLAAIRQNDTMALTESGIPLWIACALLVTPQNSDCGFLRETLDHLADGRWRLSATRWVLYAGELTAALRLCPAPVQQFPGVSELLEQIEQRRQHLQLLVDLHPQLQSLPLSGPVEKRYFPAQAAFVILFPGAAPTNGLVMPAETIRQRASDRLAQLGFGEDLARSTTVQLSTAGASSAATQQITIPSLPDLKVSFLETGGGLFGFQQHFFLYSTLLLFLATLFGLIFAYRAVSREMEVSRLKANFVASVSHEFRSPLTSILALMERLEAGKISDQENLRRYHQVIGQEVRRLSRLVNDLLDFARLEEGKKEFSREPSDLNELARQAVASFHNLGHADQVQWVEPTPGPRPIVFADRSAVGRCIQNLVDNALKYSPAGSPVSVQTGGNNGEVFVEVSDHGPGIHSEEQKKIFEHFYRIGETDSDSVKGTGLGLALVKRIMEGHGGRVTLDSEPGAGSRFRLVFPAESERL